MNREIKFRMFRDGRMQQLHQMFSGVIDPDRRHPQSDSSEYDFGKAEEEGHIMQFTGLKDKNGVEIYEGDIIKAKPIMFFNGTYIIAKVEWDSRRGLWVAVAINDKYGDVEYLFEALQPRHETEVIGNVFANPELLPSS